MVNTLLELEQCGTHMRRCECVRDLQVRRKMLQPIHGYHRWLWSLVDSHKALLSIRRIVRSQRRALWFPLQLKHSAFTRLMESSGEGSPARAHRAVLHVAVVKAQNLIGMDRNGLSDPYVEIHTGNALQAHYFVLRFCSCQAFVLGARFVPDVFEIRSKRRVSILI